jgi:hypothetical protein
MEQYLDYEQYLGYGPGNASVRGTGAYDFKRHLLARIDHTLKFGVYLLVFSNDIVGLFPMQT